MSKNPDLLKGIDAIADYLDVHRGQVLRWIEAEGLPAWRNGDGRGSPWRSSKKKLDAWLTAYLARVAERRRHPERRRFVGGR